MLPKQSFSGKMRTPKELIAIQRLCNNKTTSGWISEVI